MLQLTFKITCKFTCIFTCIYIQVANNFDTFYATKLKFGMIFTQNKTLDFRVPWVGPEVRMYNRSF